MRSVVCLALVLLSCTAQVMASTVRGRLVVGKDVYEVRGDYYHDASERWYLNMLVVSASGTIQELHVVVGPSEGTVSYGNSKGVLEPSQAAEWARWLSPGSPAFPGMSCQLAGDAVCVSTSVSEGFVAGFPGRLRVAYSRSVAKPTGGRDQEWRLTEVRFLSLADWNNVLFQNVSMNLEVRP